jgi:hypothetical protein
MLLAILSADALYSKLITAFGNVHSDGEVEHMQSMPLIRER